MTLLPYILSMIVVLCPVTPETDRKTGHNEREVCKKYKEYYENVTLVDLKARK